MAPGYTLTIPNEVLLADLARGLEWIVDPDAREPRSYSWISEILHHFKAQVLLVSSESRLSFRITPQGQSGVHSRDAPDFTFDLLEDLFSDFQLGYWEVKLLTGFKTFSRVFIRHYPQLFRYAKGMLLSNPEVDRIRTLLSCGNEFALLEWGRPRSVPFERSSPPPTTPDLPNWVPLHEKDFYAGLDDLIATLKGEGNFANLQDQDPASLSEEMHRELEHCREVLRDIEDLSPVVIFFGETILDLTGPCLTPAFSHALELLFTPYEVPPEGEQSFLPVPSWEKRKGSIFDRTVPDFQPTEKSLKAGRDARADSAQAGLFEVAVQGLNSYRGGSLTSSESSSTSYVPPEPSPLETSLRRCHQRDDWPKGRVTVDVLRTFLEEVGNKPVNEKRRDRLLSRVKKWIVENPTLE